MGVLLRCLGGGSGFRVWGLGLCVWGFGFGVSGSGFRVGGLARVWDLGLFIAALKTEMHFLKLLC